ncbi:MAG: hypothetical protein GX087_08145 [Desulfobulbaceae bacterium]|nr:hypothetical protein [Desulfobulbaceae bacterium]
MAQITVRQKGILAQCTRDWPLFYMNDFSRIGLLVDDLNRADAVLLEAGYSIEPGEYEIYVAAQGDTSAQVLQMVALLQNQRMEVEIADLINCVYQG